VSREETGRQEGKKDAWRQPCEKKACQKERVLPWLGPENKRSWMIASKGPFTARGKDLAKKRENKKRKMGRLFGWGKFPANGRSKKVVAGEGATIREKERASTSLKRQKGKRNGGKKEAPVTTLVTVTR